MVRKTFRYGRKAQEAGLFSTIVAVAGTILGILAAVLLVRQLSEQGSEQAKMLACHDSVVLRGNANINVGPISAEKITPLFCPVFDKGNIKGTDAQIKAQIAGMAADCWWMFAEGKVTNLFKKDKYNEKGCRVCYMFQLPQDVQKIDSPAMYSYLMNATYNPSLIQGGGTRKYFGNKAEAFDAGVELNSEGDVKVSEINALPIQSFIYDYTGYLDEPTRTQINAIGQEFIAKDKGNMLVVIADRMDKNDKLAATQIADKVSLKTEIAPGEYRYDAILMLVDLENGVARLHLGNSLNRFIEEFEVKEILDKNFETIDTKQDLNTAILSTLTELKNKIYQTEQNDALAKLNLRKDTYYAFVSNGGVSPVMIDNMIDKTNVVAFVAPSDDVSAWSEVWGRTKNELKGIFTSEYWTGSIWEAGALKDIKESKPNFIYIGPLNNVQKYCDMD